jgi:Ca2+-binding RTX toxin-like protein
VKLPGLLAGLLISSLVAVSALGGEAEAGHVKRCFGKRPDVNRSHDPSGSFLVLTSGSDVLIASEFADHIEGRGSPDFICARGSGDGGDEEVFGEAGNDRLNGGAGPDLLVGGAGNDLLRGGPGRDRGRGGPGRDTCVDIEVRRSCEVVH